MKACTFCLKTNIKVCQLGNSAAINFIQEIFVNNGFQELNKHNYICLICKHLLHKSFNFIQKTLRAQKTLKNIVEGGAKITVSTLKQIDRQKLDLDVNLVCHETEVNYCLWDNNNPVNYNIKTKPLNSKQEDNKGIKSEEEVYEPESGSPTYMFKYDCIDRNVDDGYENPIDNLEVKQENVIEIKVDLDPYLNLAPDIINTRRDRKHVDYKEPSDTKIKTKTRKGKGVKITCEPNEKLDRDGNYGAVKPRGKRNNRGSKKQKKIKIVDTRKYPMKCDHCKYVVQSKTEHFHHYLLYHQGIPYPYGREGKFMCQHCGITKTTAHVLHQHELTHGEKKVECAQCGKLFHNETRLKRHLKRHGAVLKICDYCNKGFVAREDLILHIRTHTGVKPFKCVLCGAGFAHRGNVAIHMRSRHQRHLPPTTPPAQAAAALNRKTAPVTNPVEYLTPTLDMIANVDSL